MADRSRQLDTPTKRHLPAALGARLPVGGGARRGRGNRAAGRPRHRAHGARGRRGHRHHQHRAGRPVGGLAGDRLRAAAGPLRSRWDRVPASGDRPDPARHPADRHQHVCRHAGGRPRDGRGGARDGHARVADRPAGRSAGRPAGDHGRRALVRGPGGRHRDAGDDRGRRDPRRLHRPGNRGARARPGGGRGNPGGAPRDLHRAGIRIASAAGSVARAQSSGDPGGRATRPKFRSRRPTEPVRIRRA